MTNNITEQITLHGFFFKRWAYEAKDAIRTAPLLVAKSFAWKPQASVQTKPKHLVSNTAVIVTATFVVLAIVGYWVTRPGRPITMPEANQEVRFSESLLAALADSDRSESADVVQRDES
jgi:hypothetical protein